MSASNCPGFSYVTHAGPHREGCPLRDGGGLPEDMRVRLARLDLWTSILLDADRDEAMTPVLELARSMSKELASLRAALAAADEPSDPPTRVLVSRGVCSCGEVHKENRLGHADGCRYFSDSTYTDHAPTGAADEPSDPSSGGGVVMPCCGARLASAPTGGTDAGGLAESIAAAIHEAECEAYRHEGRNARCERTARAVLPIVAAHVEALRDNGQ